MLVKLGIFGDIVQVRLLFCNIREQVLKNTEKLVLVFSAAASLTEHSSTTRNEESMNHPVANHSHPLIPQLGLQFDFVISFMGLVVWDMRQPVVQTVIILAEIVV